MPTVGLSMIVKNEAQTLGQCLQSVSGIVSQIVIADTGSTDNTADIAREFGATVISVPWENHFANARNAALQLMQTDWVLVLDADEELDGEARNQIPNLLRSSNAGGYLVPIRNYIPTVTGRGWDRIAEPNQQFTSPRPAGSRIFRSRELPPVSPRSRRSTSSDACMNWLNLESMRLGRRLPMAPFCIHHFGQLAQEEARNRKAAAYRDLLRLKVQDLPNDAMAWIQLGLQEYECSREPAEPLRCFERALVLEPKATAAALFKGMVYLDLGKYEPGAGRAGRRARRQAQPRAARTSSWRRAPQPWPSCWKLAPPTAMPSGSPATIPY